MPEDDSSQEAEKTPKADQSEAHYSDDGEEIRKSL